MSAASIHSKTAFQDNNKGARPTMPSFNQNGNASPSHHNSNTSQSRRTPIVYPALLSRVAEVFRERITLSERVKDGLAYTDAFDGREAVDKIAYIIKTTDRNLALLLGRALDAQKFFHDVSYEHRLRDSPYELFQFRTSMSTPFVSGDVSTVHGHGQAGAPVRPTLGENVSSNDDSDRMGEGQPDDGSDAHENVMTAVDEAPLPSGVFTLLTDCYSPTCSRDSLCYSIACPRRLEQQARLNMKPQPGLKRSISKESLGDLVVRVEIPATGELMRGLQDFTGAGNIVDTLCAEGNCGQRVRYREEAPRGYQRSNIYGTRLRARYGVFTRRAFSKVSIREVLLTFICLGLDSSAEEGRHHPRATPA